MVERVRGEPDGRARVLLRAEHPRVEVQHATVGRHTLGQGRCGLAYDVGAGVGICTHIATTVKNGEGPGPPLGCVVTVPVRYPKFRNSSRIGLNMRCIATARVMSGARCSAIAYSQYAV